MLQKRPPVITIMGHVDHGKTTLLDYIRHTNVTAGEAGGITQHIGAYSIEHNGQPLTFIDTPGHAAFSKMRERGAQATDIVVLVVAANDGVKPQTIESIRHIKSSNVSVIVAINKIDLADVNPDIAKSQLAEHGIMVTEYGGDVEAVPISAAKGTGVDKLLETLVAMADLLELKADPDAPLEAVVIESSLDKSIGSGASVIVQQGTLSVRQDIYTDDSDDSAPATGSLAHGVMGRVKLLTNEEGEKLTTVTPGYPAQIIGFNSIPAVGAIVRDQAAEYPDPTEELAEGEGAGDDLDLDKMLDFGGLLEAEGSPKIKLIIKADVQGTLEAILQNLDEDSTQLLDSGIGEVSEGDVELADASGAVIISFHTRVSGKIKKLAKLAGVKIKSYDIIYQLIEDLQKQMLKLLEPAIDEVKTGEAEVLQTFEMKGERIAGCRVITGEIKKSDLFHLEREGEQVANPVIKSMMHGKLEVDKAGAKTEFGATFKNRKLDFRVGDKLMAYHLQDDDE